MKEKMVDFKKEYVYGFGGLGILLLVVLSFMFYLNNTQISFSPGDFVALEETFVDRSGTLPQGGWTYEGGTQGSLVGFLSNTLTMQTNQNNLRVFSPTVNFVNPERVYTVSTTFSRGDIV